MARPHDICIRTYKRGRCHSSMIFPINHIKNCFGYNLNLFHGILILFIIIYPALLIIIINFIIFTMVRKYICIREKPRGDAVAAAIRAWQSGLLTQEQAAQQYGVTRGTIYNHRNDDLEALSKRPTLTQGRFKPVFTPDQEAEIKNYLINMSREFNGVTRFALGQIAFKLAEENRIQHPFKNRTAGYNWIVGFLQRNPDLSLRTATPISIQRVSGFNQAAVNRFFNNLESVVDKYNFTAADIWNMDETGITITPNRPPQVFAAKGVRSVNVIKPCERGRCITLVACMSAAGQYIPPTFIFPSSVKRAEIEVAITKGPTGSMPLVTSTGYMKATVFLDWMQHFRDAVRPTVDHPVLLLMDNHRSHLSIEAIDFSRANGIVLVTIPLHTSHKLQPLDVGLFSPMKTRYSLLMSEWTRLHRPMVPTNDNIPEIIRGAYDEATTVETAVNAFRKSGIWDPHIAAPNRLVFGPADFAAHAADPRNNVRQEPVPEEVNRVDSFLPAQATGSNGMHTINTQITGMDLPTLDENEGDYSMEEAGIFQSSANNVLVSIENADAGYEEEDVIYLDMDSHQSQVGTNEPPLATNLREDFPSSTPGSAECLPGTSSALAYPVELSIRSLVEAATLDEQRAPSEPTLPAEHPHFEIYDVVAPAASTFAIGPAEVDKPIVITRAPRVTRQTKKMHSEILTSDSYREELNESKKKKTNTRKKEPKKPRGKTTVVKIPRKNRKTK